MLIQSYGHFTSWSLSITLSFNNLNRPGQTIEFQLQQNYNAEGHNDIKTIVSFLATVGRKYDNGPVHKRRVVSPAQSPDLKSIK